MTHRERLPFAPPLPYALVFLVGLAGIGLGVVGPHRIQSGPPVPPAYDVVMALVLGTWVLAGFAFRGLDVEAGPDGITMAFGFLRRHVPRERIEAARVAPYRPVAYGGWGLRWLPGRQAWSVFGKVSGVELRVRRPRGGSQVLYVSCRDPAAVLRALGVVDGDPGPAEG